VAEVTPECLRLILQDMGAGAGWQASGALYRWYVMMCEEDNLAPVSAKAFGMALRAMGYVPKHQRVDGKITRGWKLTRRAERGLPPRPGHPLVP
jgi:hypothetical protein